MTATLERPTRTTDARITGGRSEVVHTRVNASDDPIAHLTPEDIEEIGRELDEIRASVELVAMSGVPGSTSTYQHEDLFDIDWTAFEAVWKGNSGQEGYNANSTDGYERITSVEMGATDKDVVITFDGPYPWWHGLFNLQRSQVACTLYGTW